MQISSIASSSSTKQSFLTSSVGHSHLNATGGESVRVFLHSYDQYTRDVTERPAQLQLGGVVSTENVRPVSIKLCLDIEYDEAWILLGVIGGAGSDYEDLRDDPLLTHSAEKAANSPEILSLERLDEIVKKTYG